MRWQRLASWRFRALVAEATRGVLGDPLTPKTGIGCVSDVDRVFGMEP
jgi:hypothetical protein